VNLSEINEIDVVLEQAKNLRASDNDDFISVSPLGLGITNLER